jgi:hypothetical protein
MKFDVNAVDQDGNMPLQIALGNGHIKIGDFFLERGARSEVVNRKGQTAWDCFSSWASQKRDPAGPSTAFIDEQTRLATQLYCSASKTFVNPAVSPELTNLRRKFEEFSAIGSKGLGVANARTGRSSKNSRDHTMDYPEFRQVTVHLQR